MKSRSRVFVALAAIALTMVLGVPAATAATPECFGEKATIVGAGTIIGTNGKDVIVGSSGDDYIDGLDGNDLICSLGGNDGIDSREGKDKIDSGQGNDAVFSGRDNDNVSTGGGVDLVEGGANDDLMRGRDDGDTLNGGSGTDTAEGGAGTDTCDAENEQSCELNSGAVPTIDVSDAQGDSYNGSGPVPAVFTVSLSAPTTHAVAVHYTTRSGTATEGFAFADTTGIVLFLPGETSKQVTVPVHDTGAQCDPNVTFTFVLSDPSGGVIGDGEGEGTIIDSYDC